MGNHENRGSVPTFDCLGLLVALLASLAGCDDLLSSGPHRTTISGSPQNDAIVRGQCDPARITTIVVFVCPRLQYKVEYYDELAICSAVEVTGDEAIRGFLSAISAEQPIVNDPGAIVSSGIIQVNMQDGTRLYVRYNVFENDVRVEAPSHDGMKGFSNYTRAMGIWLSRYAPDKIKRTGTDLEAGKAG